MNADPRDRELEQAYRDASIETPPPDLDARILAAAHREVGARPREALPQPGWLSRYRLPLSLAATALIAVTVSLMIEDDARRLPEADAPLAMPPARPTPAPAPPAGAPLAPSGTVPAAPPATPTMQTLPKREERLRTAPEDTMPERAPAPAAAGAAAGGPVPAAPAPAPPPAVEPQRRADPAPAFSPAAKPAPAPMESRERSLGDRPDRDARNSVLPQPRIATDAAPGTAASRSAEAWLEEIRRLRAEGRLAEADLALEAFRRQYPDHPLPEDLRR